MSIVDDRKKLEQLISFGRAKCHVCGTKIVSKDFIFMDDDGNNIQYICLCLEHARARTYNNDLYSEELQGAIMVIKKLTVEERHFLLDLLEQIHQWETGSGRTGCNRCGDKPPVYKLDLKHVPVVTKLLRRFEHFLGSDDSPWEDELWAVWENINQASRVNITTEQADLDRTDAPEPSDG